MVEIICKCGLCRYSEYNKCCNEKIKEQFKDVSLVEKISIESSKINCSEFSEVSFAHDVE